MSVCAMCSLYVGRDVSCQHIALVVFIACHLCITSHQGGSSGIIFADGETEVVWCEQRAHAGWKPAGTLSCTEGAS